MVYPYNGIIAIKSSQSLKQATAEMNVKIPMLPTGVICA